MKKELKEERVNHPKYYNTNVPYKYFTCPNCGKEHKISIECIDVIRDMPTWKGNNIKYLWREGLKQEEGISNIDKTIEDLKKAIWYLNDKLRQLEKERNV